MPYRVAYGSAKELFRKMRPDLSHILRWRASLRVIACVTTLFANSTAQAICKNTPCVPDVEPGGKGPSLQAVVSMPDLVLQTPIPIPCPPAFTLQPQKSPAPIQQQDPLSVLEQQIVAQLTNGVTQALLQLDLKHNDPPPAPDVRRQCINSVETFAVWFEPPPAYGAWDTSSARQAALPTIQLLHAGENFAFFVSHDGINRLLDVAWEDTPKRTNDAGQADPNGKLHLDGFSVAYFDLAINKQVVTSVKGWYDGPLSDDDFTVRVTDTLQLQDGFVSCQSAVDLDTTPTVDVVLSDIFNIVDLKSLLPAGVRPGPACRIAAVLPPQVLIPYTSSKVVFTYTRLDVNGNGITAAGLLSNLVPRTPSVSISGPNPLKVDDVVEGSYRAFTTDLRPPLKVTWSSPDATTLQYTEQSPEWITLNTVTSTQGVLQWNPNIFAKNNETTRLITVSITDADDKIIAINKPTAMATKLVTIKKVAYADLPEVCSKANGKAQTLPQCNP